ncbi:DUF6416 domain-containing protein [Streptomyces sp. NPDC014656]|uniref:DUF6416 domain-containing protein n=1 Tax=Streptomyces sp. NPDC014656 TaxID=3364878 RepID=UPI0037001014
MTDMTVFLTENDPRWGSHSGGSGHDSDPEWGPEDRALAAGFRAALTPNAGLVLDYLVERPGQRVHCTELFTHALGRTDGTNPASAVAGVLNGMSAAREEAGRRYPFTWWEGERGADYAVRPSTAAVFLAGRHEPAAVPRQG